MNCTDHEQSAAIAAANTCTKSRRKPRKTPKALLRAVLRTMVTSATEARAMLLELAAATGLTQRLRASLLGVSPHVIRRWEARQRQPNRGARALIALVCGSVEGLYGFEVAHLMSENALKTARYKSRPGPERVAALVLVPELVNFRRRLGSRLMALSE